MGRNSTIALLFNQSIEQSGKYCASVRIFINKNGGWLKISLESFENGTTIEPVLVYQYAHSAWLAEKEKVKHLASRQENNQQLLELENSMANDKTLSQWLTWLLLLSACLYSWLEKKLI